MGILNYLTDIIFTPACLFCGKTLPLGHRPLICDSCRSSTAAFENKCCRCGSDFDFSSGFPRCSTCHSCKHPFDGVVSSYYYSEGVRRAIIEHKFNFEYNNSRVLSEQISNNIKTLFDGEYPDFIIPVPASRKRVRQRGYDPLLEIAVQVSKNTCIPLMKKGLVKHKDVPQQTSVSGRQRVRNIRGCFRVTDKSKIKGKSFILIDDVYTTGATTRECAKVLKRAGATYILIVTVAISEVFKRWVNYD